MKANCSTASCRSSRRSSARPTRTRARQVRRSYCAPRWARGDRGSRLPRHRIPVSKMMQGERDKLVEMEAKLHERVVGPGRGRAAGGGRHPPLSRRVSRPPIARTARSCPGPTGVGRRSFARRSRPSSSIRGPPDPRRHERVHEKHSVARLIGAPPATWATRRAAPHGSGAPQALLGDPPRRGRGRRTRTSSTCCCRCSTDGRMTDGQGRTRGLQEHGDRHDLQPRLADDPADVGQRLRGGEARGPWRGEGELPAPSS